MEMRPRVGENHKLLRARDKMKMPPFDALEIQGSSSANTSSYNRLVPISTNHMLGTKTHYNMCWVLATTHTMLDIIRAKPKLILHMVVERYSFLKPLQVGIAVSCL